MDSQQLNIFEQGYFEQTTDDLDLDKLGFKIHASLIYKLGNELISNEIVALSELVKNSYDADSKYVELYVDPNYEEEISKEVNDKEENGLQRRKIGKIEIKDAGCGMSIDDIVNGWLTISNSKKRKMKKNKQLTPKYNRMPLGDKGLGRLSVQRLGKNMVLVTKKEDSNIEYFVEIPWGDFKRNTTIENINVKCSKKIVEGNLDKGYTKIIITDLENINIWNKKDSIDSLERELSKIVSPFKKSDKSFYIYGKVGERELDFEGLSEEIFQIATEVYDFKLKENIVEITGKYDLGFFVNKNILFNIKRDHIEEFINIKKLPEYTISKDSDYCLEFKQEFNLLDIGDLIVDDFNNLIINPGDFIGKIYSYYLEPNYIRNQFSNIDFKYFNDATQIGKYIEVNKGIKIFRDDFRIMPYGEGNKGDWLGLSATQAKTGKFIDLKNDNIVGYVELTGKQNYGLYEKTNREGFVEDSNFLNFEAIMKTIIKRINKSRRELSYEFREYSKHVITDSNLDEQLPSHVVATNNVVNITKKAANIEKKLTLVDHNIKDSNKLFELGNNVVNNSELPVEKKDEINKLFFELKQNICDSSEMIKESSLFIKEIESLKEQVTVIEDEYNIFIQQIEEITELAGLGIVAETLSHELYTLINNIKKNTSDINNYFNNNYPIDKKMNHYFNFILFSSESIRKQISHLAPGFKNVRMNKNKISLTKLIDLHKENYQERAERKKISINIQNKSNKFALNVNEGMVLQVFDNLYINSEYWLEHAMQLGIMESGEYNIEIRDMGIIHIWDNGLGIDKSIANHIFDAFVSNKKDGRGLGLYIVSRLLNYHKATIRLMRELNNFGNLYKFEIDFSSCITKEE